MIKQKALIVGLSISKWSARKKDKKITDEVRDQHNASEDAGQYNKRLAKKEFLDPIQKIESEARTYHYSVTLPWGDNGDRILPSEQFFEYETKMLKFKNDFEQAADDFIHNYDDVIADAQKRLNGMFNGADYPRRNDIQEKFKFKMSYLPLSDTSDFRVDLSEEEVDRLKQSMETEITSRLDLAVKDIWVRIKDQLQHMKDRLSTKDAVFRDSLFDNLKELLHVLPKLNITGDPDIKLACDQMVNILADPNAVRNNSNLRVEKAQEVEKVLNQFNSFFS